MFPKEGEKRDNLDKIEPTGWTEAKYDIVPRKKLYNKSHLIAFSLIGRCDGNISKNIITGTQQFNTSGMTRYENDITTYLKKPENANNHVLYRVTPIFEGENLLAKGVLMEAKSVEDNGRGVQYNVFIYNVQKDIKIDYATGESEIEK